MQCPQPKKTAGTFRPLERGEHGVLLGGLVASATEQGGILVGLEIAQPHNHVLGIERGGNHGHSLRQTIHKALRLLRIPDCEAVNVGLQDRIVQMRILQQRQGMHLDGVANHELLPGQAHAVVGQEGEREGFREVAYVQHHLRGGTGDVVQAHALDCERQGPVVDHAADGNIHGVRMAVRA